MRSTIAGLCILFSLFAIPASANGIHPDGYTIYEGDVNGDGIVDLYFEYQAPIIILHGDIATPVQMPKLPDFAMYGKIQYTSIPVPPYQIPVQASYDDPQEITLSQNQLAALTPLAEGLVHWGDFDGDGERDLLVYADSPSTSTYSEYVPLIVHANGNGLPAAGQQFATQIPSQGGSFSLSEADRTLVDTSPSSLTIRDVNGDGRDDMVLAGSNGTANLALLASTSGTFTTPGEAIAPSIANMAGASGGEFRVDESGAATYSIAIATAAGTAGVVPQVSLNYSGNGGNGLVGKGWSIGGLSGISRCRQTLAIDGKVAPINFTEEDRFCLDGQRLLTGSQYGAVGAVYKTELDSFTKITSMGGSPGKPAWFKVERKDGSVSEYGRTADARLVAGANTLSWMQNRFEDSVGNPILFEYDSDQNSDHRISRIKYAYGRTGVDVSASTPANAEVEFSYTGSRPDTMAGYTAGFEFETTRRLRKITSRSDGSVLRDYSLSYKPTPSGSNPDKTSLVANIQECVGSSCLPAISFDWLQPDVVYPSTGTEAIDFSYSDRFLRTYRYADINGDGKQDIVWIEGDEEGEYTRIKYAISNGSQYVKQSFSGSKFSSHYYTKVNVEKDFRLRVLDYNGDGRQDIAIYNKHSVYGLAAERWYIFLSRYNGSAWKLDSDPIYTGLSDKDAIFADFNSDGLADYISTADGSVKVRLLQEYGAEPSSDHFYKFSSTAQSYPLSVAGATSGNPDKRVPDTLGDFNGDGAMDLLVASYELETICVPCDFQCPLPQFSPNQVQSAGYCGPNETMQTRLTYKGHRVATFDPKAGNFKSMALLSGSKVDGEPVAADINGDGLTDIGYVVGTTFYAKLSTGTGFVTVASQSSAEKASFADVNNDGYPDLHWMDEGSGYVKVRYFNPSGNDFGGVQNFRYVGASDRHMAWFADVDGDGQADFHKYYGEGSNDGKVFTYLANKNNPEDKNLPRNVIWKIDNGLGNLTEITYANMVGGNVYSRLEMSTSTQTECFIEREPGSPNYGEKYCYPVTVGDPSDLYESSNGPWQLPDGGEIAKDEPVLDILAPMFLVKKVQSTAPAAGAEPGSVNHNSSSSVTYHYHQMKMQAAGRGMLGFRKITSNDNQTNVKTETVYRQDFPFTGMPLLTETKSAAGHVLSRAVNTWELKDWSCASTKTKACQPYIQKAKEETYNLKDNGATKGDLLQTVVTENTYDTYGNALTIKVTTTDAASEAQFVKQTASCYGGTMAAHPNTSCSGGTTWDKEKGRLSFSRVINTRPGMASHVRESGFTYITSGTQKGLLETEVIEPNKSAYTQTTTYEYDGFGNVNKKILSAAGEQSRSTRTEYDTAGRYAQKSYNGLEHLMETVVSRNEFGAPLEVHGLNGLQTYFSYDALGREIYKYDNTGADVRTQYLRCQSGCIQGAKYKVVKSSSTGASSAEYLDALGRVFRTETQGFSKTIYSDREYDNLGRVKFVSEPYFSGSVPDWTKTDYDLLGRPSQITAPDGSQSSIIYDGLKTITTNDKGQTKTEIKNVAGELVEVIDAIDGRLTYEYDSQGNLHKAHSWGKTDASGNHIDEGDGLTYPITVTINYDHLGRKDDMNDPDKGFWDYEYNKYGELEKQTNANGHTVEYTYDVLGRKKTRIDTRLDEGGGTTETANVTWYYDTATNGLGQVEMVEDSVSGYQVVNQYDTVGRNDTQLVDFDGAGPQPAYVTTTQFDGYGRLLKSFDTLDGLLPSGQSGTENHYNGYGYLEKITDLATGDLIKQTLEQTARGQLKRQLLGNGATSTFGYDSQTGRLLSQTSDVLGVFGIQKITYQWDTLGNLTSRHNQSGGKNLRESFCYDDLNRLVKTHIGASNYNCGALTLAGQDVKYNAIGNITYKAGVGNYSYGQNGAGPHAVTTAGGVSYSYDDNGNMTSDGFDGGRSIDYTTFDKAEKISKGGHTTEFLYGVDRSRYYRKDTDSSGETTETWYIGNIERIQKSGAPAEIQWKRHLAGAAVYTVKTDLSYAVQSTEKVFLYRDHLGSMDLLTDGSGKVVQQMSFDAWGQRRNALDWSSLTLPALASFDHSRITRGYTGHEMLDEVGLIHMNGRIYDPRLGRFMQADPFIQAAADTQMYNRYSYVRNNPLNATDPSGYFFEKLLRPFKKAARSFMRAIGQDASSILGSIVSSFCGPWKSACQGAWSYDQARAFGADPKQARRIAAISAASAWAFSKAPQWAGASNTAGAAADQTIQVGKDAFVNGAQFTKLVAFHGMIGGVQAELSGGKFGHGFVSAGVTKAFSPAVGNIDSDAGQFAATVILGGSVSEMTGGKFRNGAATAAMQYLYNYCSSGQCSLILSEPEWYRKIFGYGSASEADAAFSESLSDITSVEVTPESLSNLSTGSAFLASGCLIALQLECAGPAALVSSVAGVASVTLDLYENGISGMNGANAAGVANSLAMQRLEKVVIPMLPGPAKMPTRIIIDSTQQTTGFLYREASNNE